MWSISFHFVFVLFLCFNYRATECTDLKFSDLEGKQLNLINDVGISGEYDFGTLKLDTLCNDKQKCLNGGTCYNNTCICLPGTSGPLCDTINNCNYLNCSTDKKASCDFDQRNFKAFCKCPFGQEFDYDNNICKDCLCDKCTEGRICFNQVKCEIIRGEKACTCRLSGYRFNPKTEICEFCYCGSESEAIGCEFDEDGKQKCNCERDYAQNGEHCESCECYGYGSIGCKFVNYDKVCLCLNGYVEVDGACYECTCGEHGSCKWETGWSRKQVGCICDPGFIELNGVCKELEECYCGENSNCTLQDNEKICSCQDGFTYMNGLCVDINECDNPKTCPENMTCFNLIGSYECKCADGFHFSNITQECEDIDECKGVKPCTGSNIECFNTVGSYSCVCKSGYATRDGITANPICESKSSWKLGLGLLVGIFLAVIVILIVIIYK